MKKQYAVGSGKWPLCESPEDAVWAGNTWYDTPREAVDEAVKEAQSSLVHLGLYVANVRANSEYKTITRLSDTWRDEADAHEYDDYDEYVAGELLPTVSTI